jgi:hypothetical protein
MAAAGNQAKFDENRSIFSAREQRNFDASLAECCHLLSPAIWELSLPDAAYARVSASRVFRN